MIEIGKLVFIEPGEAVIEEDDLMLIRSLLSVVAKCPEASDLAERLEDYFGEELTYEEINRFTIGPDNSGELAVLPNKE